MELNISVDITDRTEAALTKIAKAIDNLGADIAISQGDFQKAATQTIEETVNPVHDDLSVPKAPEPKPEPKKEEPTKQEITEADLRAFCAKAKAKGVNVRDIIHTVGKADMLRNVDPSLYGAVYAEVEKELNA